MNCKWLIFLAHLLINNCFFSQELINKWDIPPYTIELYRVEQVQESYGGIDLDAIRIFTTHNYTVLQNKYIPSEWQAPYLPRYQITIYQGKAKHEILFYWDRYIIDNYIYSTGGNSGTGAADKHFWESNLKLNKTYKPNL